MRDDELERWVGQEFGVRDASEQLDAVELQAATQDIRQLRMRDHVDLVHHRPEHRHPVRREQRPVEDDLVDRPADAALADDDDRCLEHGCGACVREPDDGTDAGVPRALDHHQVPAVRHPLVRPEYLGLEIVGDTPQDEVGGEPARQRDRRHVVEGVGQAVDLLDQHRVLVGPRPVDDQVALSDRLHESQLESPLPDGRDQPEAGRRLAAILAGRRQEDALGRHPIEATSGSSCGARPARRPRAAA